VTHALHLTTLDDPWPADGWRAQFARMWPAYEAWFLKEGDRARPPYAVAARRLREHMPELVPVWDELVELAGGGDRAARMLALWRPTPFMAACSQAVHVAGEPVLVRNYDWAPERFEAVVVRSAWTGRHVLGTSDCLWGLLDGVNDAGLAVSLTFGGRRVVGDGFGVPLLVRYLLETCTDVAEAVEAIRRVPVNLAHNLTLVDAAGEYCTAWVAPDRPLVLADRAVATNHQDTIEWPEHAAMTRTGERERHLQALLDDPATDAEALADAFLAPPLLARDYARGFGTLYTAVLRPSTGVVEYRWPGTTWRQSLDVFDRAPRVQPIGPALAA
jgi:predicted choloylglycine hydrolase